MSRVQDPWKQSKWNQKYYTEERHFWNRWVLSYGVIDGGSENRDCAVVRWYVDWKIRWTRRQGYPGINVGGAKPFLLPLPSFPFPLLSSIALFFYWLFTPPFPPLPSLLFAARVEKLLQRVRLELAKRFMVLSELKILHRIWCAYKGYVLMVTKLKIHVLAYTNITTIHHTFGRHGPLPLTFPLDSSCIKHFKRQRSYSSVMVR